MTLSLRTAPESSSSMVSSVCAWLTGDSRRNEEEEGEQGEGEGQGEGSRLLLLSIINVLLFVMSPKETLLMSSLLKILSMILRFVDREDMSGSSSRVLFT